MISVIVPIYNVDDYLSTCISSIINQTYKDLEIILVDDGSTDHSGQICEEFDKLDNRVQVIHKKNGETEVDFYNQMDVVFKLFNEVLEPQGHIGFVVGRSIIRGKVIDNTKLISDVAKKRGFVLCADIQRNIAATKKSFNLKYGKINTEDLLVFRKD